MQTFSDKEIMIAANAIGWVLYGDDSEDGAVVEVPNEKSEQCIEAAKRALRSIEAFRQMPAKPDEQ